MDNHERSQTPNRGAADARDSIVRKIRSMRDVATDMNVVATLDELEEWIHGMSERATQKVGGLGRR